MRVLLTVNPAPSHLFTMVPLAWSLHLHGHRVLVAAPRSLAQHIRRAGLTAAVAGADATFLTCWPAGAQLVGRPHSGLGVFLAIAERTVADLLVTADAWQPDLIIADPVEFAGPVAAAKTGVPWVRHEWGLPVPAAEMRHHRALEADRLAALGPAGEPVAVVDTCPPSLRSEPPGATVRPMRYVPYATGCTAPDWLLSAPDRPRIAVSMGSTGLPVFAESLGATLEALSGLDAEIVVSGSGAESLTRLPANVRRTGWVPHHLLLPGCDLLIHHGGSNSAMAALAAGLPQVIVPHMMDQFEIAGRLAAAGLARAVPYTGRDPVTIRAAVDELLGDPAYARRAARVRAEIAAMPPPAAVAAGLSSDAAGAGRGGG